MKNIWPKEYLHNPNIEKPIEEIWDDIDSWSFEEMYEKDRTNKLSTVVILPPMFYEGKFIKGVFYSNAVRTILKNKPWVKNLFFICANSMFASYPYADMADMFFTCYKNQAREEHYLKKYPERKNIVFLPLQDSDFLNEYYIAPKPCINKTIDVFCVSTPFPVKNLPMLANALKIYEKKYNKILNVHFAIGQKTAKLNQDGSLDYSGVTQIGKDELKKVDEILGDTKKYIKFYPWIDYKDLPKYYSKAKCFVLCSLIEGKNRSINEALSCDVPVIVFKDFNKYVRGDFPVFYGNSGEYVPEYTPESLADTIHKVISNQQNYKPRKNYLQHYGRRNFTNAIIDSLPYYKKNLPNYKKGEIFNNLWVDLACFDNYQISYHDFVYEKKSKLMHVVGLEDIEELFEDYYKKFNLMCTKNEFVSGKKKYFINLVAR